MHKNSDKPEVIGVEGMVVVAVLSTLIREYQCWKLCLYRYNPR